MSKKLIISLSVVLSIIAVVLVLFWTLFGLSSVTVEYSSTTKNLTVSEEEIVEAGGFRYGACVLFEGKKKSIEKIYDKATENENFAYIRVTNIETVFPNKFVVHISEREELFAVEHGAQVFICDRDLRVLKIEQQFDSTDENAILVKNLTIKNQDIKVGNFLDVEEVATKKLYSAFLKNNKDFSQQIGKFESLDITKYQDETTQIEYYAFNLTSFSGQKFVINNPEFALAQKIQKMFAVESQLYASVDTLGNITNSQGVPLEVVETETGELVGFDSAKHDVSKKFVLTVELLKNYAIKVDNFTLTEYHDRNEKDIYYSLVNLKHI